MSYVTSRDGTRIAYDRSDKGPALTSVLRHASRRTLDGQDHGVAPEVLAEM